ncbi:leucine rich repeat protein-like protein [Pseudovirgaria hyperparasitica]|uniref:Leucine rich repeat protein-like protein n=1 Tax=Pseudovirgaria hyperparasitica TaxID=470096 RepID=A0A6A6W2Y6_9PEZI|nr:leucine rich repeat protein-like protein [Pseudovirgaria hyperparasitica]KAF2755947.1 leucine rich repeat protein-like protein [Pseudovirgaria hyperparasitica]
MPKLHLESDSSLKRRSLFARTPLRALTPINTDDLDGNSGSSTNLLKKRRASSAASHAVNQIRDKPPTSPHAHSPASPSRSEKPTRGALSRPASLMGSWKLSRSSDSYDDIGLLPSSTKSSFAETEDGEASYYPSEVLLHGEVQTSSSMFRKKREYLVLTETHLVRFKSQQKATESFSSVSPSVHRIQAARHSYSPSTGSMHDLTSGLSEHSGERELGTPLRHVVGVYRLDDGRPWFALEIASLDEKNNNASAMTLQFGEPKDMDLWLRSIREAANRVRRADAAPISLANSTMVARVVEREQDYEPPNFSIHKVVLRPGTKNSRSSSSDDILRVATTVCFLAIGVHKVHLIPLSRSSSRGTTSTLGSQTVQESHGVLTLTYMEVDEVDDSFEMTFRTPLRKPKVFQLASLASHEIAIRLRAMEEQLRPEWESRPFKLFLPKNVSDDILRNANANAHAVDLDSLDRTLIGYCVAYDVNPSSIRYKITHPEDDGPCFQLLPPVDRRTGQYGMTELLAIMRALRYNETFGSLSFADVQLDTLNGVADGYGFEHVCTKTKRGTPIQMSSEKLNEASLLVQEIRALAVTNRKLRRLDFTSCILRRPSNGDETGRGRDLGCGIVEALFPLCKHNTTNVDWIILNNIQLGETDLDYLVEAAVLRTCHFRGFGFSNTGLSDRTLSFVLDALRNQENTLEALDLSRNIARITPSSFDSHIGAFAFIRKLNLANLSRTSGPEPLMSAETLDVWRLSELTLSGVPLNTASVDALCMYLHNFKQSKGLRELCLDHTFLNGKDIALIMQTMTENPGEGREMHLDVSQNNIELGLVEFTRAIASGYAPKYLTLRLLEFEDEGAFRKLVLAIAANTTILSLDFSQASLPSDASDATCKALEKMFSDNRTLQYLDISGEESRLETTKLGVGVNRALWGLTENTSLRTLWIRFQKLGIQGASTLADVLKSNQTLTEVHCEHNGINLSGFTDLVNALNRNTTLLYLPEMDESRQIALKQTEDQVKQMRDDVPAQGPSKASSARTKFANMVGMPTIAIGKDRTSPGPSSLSDQDIKAALALVDESWDRQVYRLRLYLQRNIDIANGVPTNLEIDEEDFERPDTGTGSISKMIEQAKIDSTPTLEKQISFSAYLDTTMPSSGTTTDEREQDELDFYKEIASKLP